MNKTVKINGKDVFVSFSGYFDSAIGDLLFTQVMCDVFLPGNEVVPIDVEKAQIRRVVDGFKKRKALYDEIKKENVKGKRVYVINPRMRYDLSWLEGKKKLVLTKEKPPQLVPIDPAVPDAETTDAGGGADRPIQRKFTGRRQYLLSQGFRWNEAGKAWEQGGIRFPDALVDKPSTDEEFAAGMQRLLEADARSGKGAKRKPKTT